MRLRLSSKVALFCLAVSSPAMAYEGSSFNQVWDTLKSDPYAKPYNKVTVESFYEWGRNKMEEAASRTLTDLDDLIPHYTKLVHANGICLKGEWVIDSDSPYTGYFAKGSKGLFIARSSVASSAILRGERRAFGFSGKLFPTLDPDSVVKTASFVAIDDLGGTMTDHYLDAAMTNEPGTSFTPPDYPIAAGVVTAFLQVDTHIGIRQMYPFSEIGTTQAKAVTPYWFRVVGRGGQPRLDEKDFRDELDVSKFANDTIIFDIAVASNKDVIGTKNWQTIGHIDLTDSVISDSCDHRIHFHHAPWRDDVNYSAN